MRTHQRGAVCLFAALMLIGTNANAENLYIVDLASDWSSAEFIDAGTIRQVGTDIQVWTTTVFNPRKTPPHNAAYEKGLNLFDCNNQRLKVVYIVFYFADGSVADQYEASPYTQASVVVPGSIGASDLAFACENPADRPVNSHVNGPLDVSHVSQYLADQSIKAALKAK